MSKANQFLLAASFTAYFSESLFGPIYAIFVKNIGGDVLTAGVTYGIFAIVTGIFIFTVGRTQFFKDHVRGMIVLGFGMLALGGVGYLLVRNPAELFILQVFMGIANGILEPSWNGVFSADLSEEQSIHFWAIFGGGQQIAVGIGAIVGGVLVTLWSFQILFILVACLNTLSTIFATRIFQYKLNSSA